MEVDGAEPQRQRAVGDAGPIDDVLDDTRLERDVALDGVQGVGALAGVEPLVPVSGVRSSWATIATKSSLAR